MGVLRGLLTEGGPLKKYLPCREKREQRGGESEREG